MWDRWYDGTSACAVPSGASVGMQPRDPEVDCVEVGEDGHESDDGDEGRARLAPPVGDPRVQVDGEDHPHDEAERLLGIPPPVPTPCVLPPDRPHHHPEGPDGEADHHEAVAPGIERLRP